QADPTGFSTAQDLAQRQQREVQRQQRRWLAASEEIRRDPGLLVYYNFQPKQTWSRTLTNLAGGGRQPQDGAIVGCSWETGRWQGVHYVDGQPVSHEAIVLDVPLRIGDVELGNWTVADSSNRTPIRYFSGCMDEFLMFSRPLSDEEIQRLYTQGQPLR